MWMSLLLLFHFFQVEQPHLITPAWINTNWIWLLCEWDTQMLQSKVVSEAEIKFSACGEETYTPLSPVSWREGKKKSCHQHQHWLKTCSQVRAERADSPGPNSDRLYTEPFQGEQHVKRTALLFLSLRIFVGHICKPLSIITIMQDFGHTCCCQPTVVSEMIESTAERIFLINYNNNWL